jgi:hypothetical protein
MGDLLERAARLLPGRGDADLDEEMEAEEQRQREGSRPKPSLPRLKSTGILCDPANRGRASPARIISRIKCEARESYGAGFGCGYLASTPRRDSRERTVTWRMQ